MNENQTPLGAYTECLHVLESLPPNDRALVIKALGHLVTFSPEVLGPKPPKAKS